MEQKEVVLFKSKEDCCGCGACMNVCPKDAITMKVDEYGFLYPEIDREKCIKCGACNRACAYQNNEVTNRPLETYVAVNKNTQQKMNSASGGVFSALATKILQENGIVFGSALEKINDEFVPHHIAITNIEELGKLQGSKYVQSSIEYTYKEANQYLQEGKKVLFSGTPCQIAGLYGFLKKDYDNLITIDLICHGVPNGKLFNDYLKSVEKKHGCQIEHYVFRDKKKGWGMNSRIDFLTKRGNLKTKYLPARLTSYNTLFLDGLTYRENCYSCKYACQKRPGDITIGDYWGISREHPEIINKECFIEKDGISCMIINSEKGKVIRSEIDKYLDLRETTFQKVANKNGQLKSPSKRSERREEVINLYRNQGYIGIENYFKEKYKKQRIMHFVFNKLPRNLRNLAKTIVNK